MDDELASLRAEVAALRLTLGGMQKDYGKEVAPIISDVLLMGRGVYDTPLAMANALIKRLRLKGYGIRKDK